MRNFKKIIKLLLKLTVVIVFAIMFESFFSFLVMPDSLHSKFMIEDMYNSENIDVLIVGSSLSMTGVDPFVFEESCGKSVFNASSSLQQTSASYFVLKEALKYSRPEKVIFGANYSIFGEMSDDNRLQSNLIVYEYLKPSINKLDFLFSVFSLDESPEALLKSYHYRNNFKLSMLKPSNIAEKLGRQRNTVLQKTVNYLGKGFAEYTAFIEQGNMGYLDYVPLPEIDPEAVKYLEKMIELCNAQGIDFIIASPPMSKSRMVSRSDYFSVQHDFFNSFADKFNVTYIDFNFVKPKFLSLSDIHFRDGSHMNAVGAKVLTPLLSDIVFGKTDTENLYFSSFDDVLTSFDEISGVSLTAEKTGDRVLLTARAQYAPHLEAEYEFSAKLSGGQYEIISPYSKNAEFTWQTDESETTFRVKARAIGSEKPYEAFFVIYP